MALKSIVYVCAARSFVSVGLGWGWPAGKLEAIGSQRGWCTGVRFAKFAESATRPALKQSPHIEKTRNRTRAAHQPSATPRLIYTATIAHKAGLTGKAQSRKVARRHLQRGHHQPYTRHSDHAPRNVPGRHSGHSRSAPRPEPGSVSGRLWVGPLPRPDPEACIKRGAGPVQAQHHGCRQEHGPRPVRSRADQAPVQVLRWGAGARQAQRQERRPGEQCTAHIVARCGRHLPSRHRSQRHNEDNGIFDPTPRRRSN